MSIFRVINLDHSDRKVASEIHAVMSLAYKVEAEILGMQNFPPLHRRIEEIVTSDDESFRGIFVEGILAAVVEINFLEPGNVHIDSLVVRPDYFRRGLATALLQHIFRSYFAHTITVATGARNQPALLLYGSQGFKENLRWSANDCVAMITLKRLAENE